MPVVTVGKVRMVSMVQRAEPGKAGLAEWQYTAFGITVYPTNKQVKATVEKAFVDSLMILPIDGSDSI